VIFLFSSQTVSAFSGYGEGTSNYPYQITSCALLQEMANNLTVYYEQNNDIDCTGITFTPVGNDTNKFSGNFNGNNFAISTINISGSGYVGLFGYTENATISNVRLISGTVTSTDNDFVGSLIGWANTGSAISHCSAALTIPGTAGSFIGGLLGHGSGTSVTKSFYNGTINSNNATPNNVAGLIAGIAGTSSVANSYASGTYNSTIPGYGGGLIGALYGTPTVSVTNVYASASITLGANVTFGGIAGAYGQTMSNSFSAVTKSGSTSDVFGGVFGYSGATVTNVHFDATLNGTSNCSGDTTTSCTAQNSGNSTPNYFKGNSTNVPMSSWDFTDIWQVNSGDYPTLRGFTSPASINPVRSPNTTSSAPSSNGSESLNRCTDSAPIAAPNLFQVDAAGTYANLYFSTVNGSSGYNINYGLTSEANQYGDSFGHSGNQWTMGRTVSGLTPNTTYYFRVQAANGCNAGKWSQTVAVKTKNEFASNTQFFANLSQSNSNPTLMTAKSSGKAVAGVFKTPESCSYTVQEGDSFWKIASQELGSGSRFGEIQGLNPGVGLLQISQKISLCK